MTDYLEALIDAGEQADQEQALSWKKSRLLPAQLAVAENDGGFTDSVLAVGGTALPAGRNILSQVDEAWAQEGAVPTLSQPPDGQPIGRDLHTLSWSLELELRKLHRAVRPQKARSSALPLHSAQQGFSENGFFLSPASGRGGPAGYAELVDMHFARDARRYDGPLRLL